MTVKSVILLILGGVLANNFVFEKFLGLPPLLGFAKKDNKLTALGLSVFVVILLTSPLTWAVQSYVLAPAGLEALQLLVFVALILCVVWLVELIAKAIFKKGLGVYFPVIALNGAVLDDESCAGEGGSGYCRVVIDETSSWTVTGDSTVTALECAGTILDSEGNTVTILGTDGTVYAEGTSSYTITVESYSETADVSGAGSISL